MVNFSNFKQNLSPSSWFRAKEVEDITSRYITGFNLFRVCNVEKLRQTSPIPFLSLLPITISVLIVIFNEK